ncbi:MAG: transglutaminase-like domain-containing protein [Bacillota bacterium]
MTSRGNRYTSLIIGACLLMLSANGSQTKQMGSPRTRSFLLNYHGEINGLIPGQAACIWLPVPSDSSYQTVKEVSRTLGASSQIGRDQRFGNKILYFQQRADRSGQIRFQITYRITRQEVRSNFERGHGEADAAVDQECHLFLGPDANVPVGGKTMTLLKGIDLPTNQLQLGRLLYDVVNRHMTYAKDTPGSGRGDAVWACESGRGNCSDFHSLFIALARGNHLPAKFEIGFSLPAQRGQGTISGYHCWGWFKPHGYNWIPVDISEAKKDASMRDYYFGNLTENRVVFSVGRSLVLVPRQAGPPLNFFVNPYAEVDKKPYPADKIRCWCEYQDTHGNTD